jgi:hypothetical protein
MHLRCWLCLGLGGRRGNVLLSFDLGSTGRLSGRSDLGSLARNFVNHFEFLVGVVAIKTDVARQDDPKGSG